MELGRVRKPDVAVCDLVLPDGNGASVLAALKEMDPGMEVVIITGNATLESALACLRNGAYDYVTKPFHSGDLARVADRALERRRLSRRLIHYQELNRLKTEFIAGMSHELRTPLNAVIGYVSLVLDLAYGPLEDRQRQALARVDVNARNLLSLINNILDVSKVGAGRMELYLETFSLAELLREVVEGMESISAAKKLTLAWHMNGDVSLRADRMKLKQALVNLTGNGLKFTREGGVDLRAEKDGEKVRIRVSDTGIGIRPEEVPRLFQEFKQADDPAARLMGGTGLGLAITRKLMGLMGGTVSVESELGKGSVFTLMLPLTVQEPKNGDKP
jgi:signal transduction histidine kinase